MEISTLHANDLLLVRSGMIRVDMIWLRTLSGLTDIFLVITEK